MSAVTAPAIEKLRIDDTDVYLEELGPGKGKVTLSDAYGHNYSYYWGAMGSPLKEFLCRIDSGYFAKNLMGSTRYYVPDWRKTFATIRKFIRKDLGLPWYKHMEFQEDMREKLNDFQAVCVERNSADLFISLFHSEFIKNLAYFFIEDEFDRKYLEKDFNSISEPWHFIVETESPEYMWLARFHGKLKKQLSRQKKGGNSNG